MDSIQLGFIATNISIAIISLLSCIIVVWTMMMSRGLHTKMSVFVLSLFIAQSFLAASSLVCILDTLKGQIHTCRACLVLRYFAYISVALSVCCITIERFIRLRYLTFYKITLQRHHLVNIAVGIWSYSLVLAVIITCLNKDIQCKNRNITRDAVQYESLVFSSQEVLISGSTLILLIMLLHYERTQLKRILITFAKTRTIIAQKELSKGLLIVAFSTSLLIMLQYIYDICGIFVHFRITPHMVDVFTLLHGLNSLFTLIVIMLKYDDLQRAIVHMLFRRHVSVYPVPVNIYSLS